MKNIIIFFLLLFPSVAIYSGTLEGHIHSENGDALPGVNITIIGTVLGTSSTIDGKYHLSDLAAGSYSIRFTMMGFRQVIKEDVSVPAEGTVKIDITMKETIIETPEILISANKRRQNIQDSPNSVGIITQKDFKEKNEIYLDNLLEHASGVNFMRSQINIRGSSGFSYGAGSRILFLVDGVPVMPGDSGDIKWDLIPASQIDHVEIIKGAGSAVYGSNALGGVINVITKEASAKPVTNLRLSAGFYDKPAYPEWQWTDRLLHFDEIDIDHTRKLSHRSEIFVALGKHQSTGYRQNNFYQRYNASMKYHTRLGQQSNLTLSSSYEGGDRGAGLLWRNQRYALEVDPEALADHTVSNKFSLNSFYQSTLNKKLGVRARLSYFRNYWKNFFHDNISASTANRFGVELQGEYQPSKDNSYIFGSEESYDLVRSDLVGDHYQYVLSAFIQNERAVLSTLRLTIGLRFDHHYVDTGFADSEWNPKIGLVWRAQPNISLRASSGRGFRAASMSERFADSIYSGLRLLPNENLKSETAWSHEIGVNASLTSQLYFDLSFFQNDYWDLIEPEPNENQVIQFVNLTRARIRGVEASIKINPWIQNLFTEASITVMDPKNLDENTVLAYRPKYFYNLSLTYSWQFFDIGGDYRFVEALKENAVKLYPNDERVPQRVANAFLALSINDWKLTFYAKNIFNHNHTQVERTILPIRHYTLTLASKF